MNYYVHSKDGSIGFMFSEYLGHHCEGSVVDVQLKARRLLVEFKSGAVAAATAEQLNESLELAAAASLEHERRIAEARSKKGLGEIGVQERT